MKLVGPGTIITFDSNRPVVTDGGLVIEDNLIKEIGDYKQLIKKYESKIEDKIKTDDKLIMPGMVNTHMHLYSTFARGMAIKDDPPQDFVQILERLWWRLDKALDYEGVYYSALLAIIEGIKNGTTTIFDHHASPNAISGSLDKISEAVNETGIRACLSYEVSDRDGKEKAQEGIEENKRFIKKCKEKDSELIKSAFGLHASFTLSNETLQQVSKVVNELETGIHMHVAEGKADQEDSLSKYDLTVIERLEELGLCNSKMIGAHGVHLQPHDMEILSEHNANLIHNPESNMGNAVGYPPIFSMLDKGVLVGHGTDGFTTDMFESIKVANLLHKHNSGNPSAAWEEVPTITFENNQKITNKFYDKPLAVLKEGGYADLIAVDYRPTTPLSSDNYYPHILFGISGGKVEMTMVNGQVLMEDGEVKVVDEEEIYHKARLTAKEVWKRF
ncbi:putative aminohydrolase SsnA [Selenihalanaerobacter shriftii]|uniref:Putative selenium metabolism protein SsnA n=1 Tax=Selenihalanaerobacter shriftii TaxID=142842 RepID=A0A1T4PJG4_9FIRM|nr:putative aminohydrolase SsnA [Selenihalanaerobacter shriftii]SJZ91725.1 putative selenium metabolism protein SsnA [Selenihalanaerobacter shriftii]